MQSLQSVLFTLINHEAVTGTKTRLFELKNRKIFWGGAQPLPRPHKPRRLRWDSCFSPGKRMRPAGRREIMKVARMVRKVGHGITRHIQAQRTRSAIQYKHSPGTAKLPQLFTAHFSTGIKDQFIIIITKITINTKRLAGAS